MKKKTMLNYFFENKINRSRSVAMLSGDARQEAYPETFLKKLNFFHTSSFVASKITIRANGQENKRSSKFSQYGGNLTHPLLWAVFILYLIVLGYTIAHHELWGDELHSWNIAKGSDGFGDLIYHTRYEGHPPLWYTILWIVSKFTHELAYMQLAQMIIASMVVFFVLFFSPFPLITRILIPFGYYFLFEYGVLSRNYSAALLFAFLICIIMHRNFKAKLPLYYTLLFLMSNVHMLAVLLACSLHLYFLLLQLERKKKFSTVALHAALGLVIILPALYFIYPPPDGEMNLKFWLSKWNISQLFLSLQAPLRCFLPIPAWWNEHFWNTEFLLEWKNDIVVLKYVYPVVALGLLATAFFILRKNKKCLVLFCSNLLLNFLLGFAFLSLITSRYSGFIFIGFLVAYWLYFYETLPQRPNNWLVNCILIVHLIAGIFFVSKDIRYAFSNLYKMNSVLEKVPPHSQLVTDYWALNAVSAYRDKPCYCIDIQKKISFIMWGADLARIQNKPDRYWDGVNKLFHATGLRSIYMVSMESPDLLSRIDSKLFNAYRVVLIDKKDGAIEKGSNLYLYQISSF